MKLIMRILIVSVLAIVLSNCGTRLSKAKSSDIEKGVCAVENSIDSFYLEKCYYNTEEYKIETDSPKIALQTLQVIKADFKKCYTTHNELVDQINKE